MLPLREIRVLYWENFTILHINILFQFTTDMQESLEQPTKELQEGRWTQQQHLCFLRGIIRHGKDWKAIEDIVQTRQGSQVRSHSQKFFIKLNKASKERKRGKSRDLFYPTQIQKIILNNFTEEDLTSNTPNQIVYVITHDWTVPEIIHSPKKKTKKAKHVTELKKLSIEDEKGKNYELPRIQEEQEEDDNRQGNEESFFIQLLKFSKQHISSCKQFFNLFEFGQKDQVPGDQPQTSIKDAVQPGFIPCNPNLMGPTERKKSFGFGLPNSEEDPQKLQQALNNLYRFK